MFARGLGGRSGVRQLNGCRNVLLFVYGVSLPEENKLRDYGLHVFAISIDLPETGWYLLDNVDYIKYSKQIPEGSGCTSLNNNCEPTGIVGIVFACWDDR